MDRATPLASDERPLAQIGGHRLAAPVRAGWHARLEVPAALTEGREAVVDHAELRRAGEIS